MNSVIAAALSAALGALWREVVFDDLDIGIEIDTPC
jgi:hypothetical protein